MPTTRIYTFDHFRLDCSNFALSRDAETIPLQPRTFDTLLYLVEHAGSIVTKEELIRHVWADAAVQDNALMRCISQLRKALDDAEGDGYIRTIPGQGYQFCATVTALSADNINENDKAVAAAAPQAAILSPRKRRAVYLWAAILVVVAIFAALIVKHAYKPSPEFRLKQLTTNSREQPILAACISPDGKLLAFTDASGAYIRHLDTNVTEKLKLPDELIPVSTNWFPDQTHLLVSGYDTRTRDTRLLDVTTHGAWKALPDNLENWNLSCDGRHLIYLRKKNQLWIANSDGDEDQLLAELRDNEQFMYPLLTCDNRYLIYVRTSVEQRIGTIEARRLSDNSVRQLYASGSYIQALAMISSDELLISQVREPDLTTSELVSFKVSLAAGSHSTPRVIARWPGHEVYDIYPSYDGNNIVVFTAQSEHGIYVADLSADGTAISNLKLLTHDVNIARPTGWLPDSRTILFFSNRNGNYDIFKQHIDEVEATALTSDAENDVRAVASADQKWLFYFTTANNVLTLTTPMTLKRKLLAGSVSQVISTSNDAYRRIHCAALKNTCVLAEHTTNEAVFYEFDPELGRRKEIARIGWTPWGTNYDWDISPDGRYIAYIDHEAGPNQVGIISLQQRTNRTRLLVAASDPLRTLTWDATGSGFYISTHDDGGTALRLLHVALDGSVHELRLILNAMDGWAIPSPDGKHLAIEQSFTGGNIWLLQR